MIQFDKNIIYFIINIVLIVKIILWKYYEHIKHNIVKLSDYNINEKKFKNIIVKLVGLKYSLIKLKIKK